jgi:hypothetical protein
MKKQARAKRSKPAARLAVDAAELQVLVAQLVAEQLQEQRAEAQRAQERRGLQRPAPAAPRDPDDEAYADAWVAC